MNALKEKLTFLFTILGITLSSAQEMQAEDLINMSLEELLSIDITSVSKKAEKLQTLPNAIYVLTSEDIIESGATNMIEVLRLIPGFWVLKMSTEPASFLI